MKRGRLPLTALRSFEAAGRHLSFTRAAEELYVSQAAVSRQIRELEVQTGKPLFERLHRRVELTDAGRQLLGQLTRSFDDIDQRLSQIQADSAQKLLKISVEPCFGGSWLMPRLIRFRERRPDIDVSVDVSGRLVEFRNHEAELAIRFSLTKTSWPRVQSAYLMDTKNAPVLSPAFCSQARRCDNRLTCCATRYCTKTLGMRGRIGSRPQASPTPIPNAARCSLTVCSASRQPSSVTASHSGTG
jgi:LysR family glycine cleavage system transcriptional activator